jgi:hypothetical protein
MSEPLNFGKLSAQQVEPTTSRQLGIEVDTYHIRFVRWGGEPPLEHRSTYRLVYYGDELAPYPELAFCQGLRDGGASDAVWAESKDAARRTWHRRWSKMQDLVPPRVCQVLNDIHAQMGSPRYGPGVWEIVSWWTDPFRIHFCEVKGPGDKLSDSQIRWLGAAAEVVGTGHFSLIRYTVVDS